MIMYKVINAYFFVPFIGDENKDVPDTVKGQWALNRC